MAEPLRITIVGAGIAGLAAAVALRAPGRLITILERSSMLKEVGALISLQPNASKIVSSWGIDEFLEPYEPLIDQAFRILDLSGTVVREIKLDTSKFGADRIVYHRQDLHAGLKAAALSDKLPGPPAEIRTSAPVVSCDPDAGTVTLQNGELVSSDVLIGADGVHSVLRDHVVGQCWDALPTGISAYRLLIPIELLDGVNFPVEVFKPSDPITTMIIGHSKRVIMGPGRGGKILGIVGLVPDEHMHERAEKKSWVTEGSKSALLETFKDFPSWLLQTFSKAPEVALWQLRDIDPLSRWVRGRTILIGDAAHAMLPTQGQGASQSIEDAEALQAFLSDIHTDKTTTEKQVHEALANIQLARIDRASLIQRYSRDQAKPGTASNDTRAVRLDPTEFQQYNCEYSGSKDWLSRIRKLDMIDA